MAATKQIDLFLESIVDAPIKDERNLMEFPFFSLMKGRQLESRNFTDEARGISIDIIPGKQGMATIWDKDVLIYCASLINDRIERQQAVDRTIYFHAYDFLRLTGRGTGKRAYELMLDALDRLQSTSIRTNLTSGKANERERRGFSWIESFRVVERPSASGKAVMVAIEVTMNKWLWRSLVEDRRVLTINPDYFRISAGIGRRLYELARKHCGHQESGWQISLEKLWKKCGSGMSLRHFKRVLVSSIKAGIPDYTVTLHYDKNSPDDIMFPDEDRNRWGRNARIMVFICRSETLFAAPALGTSLT